MKRQPVLHTTQLNPDPDVIDLGVGQPQLSLLPLELVRRAADKKLGDGDASLLQYGAEPGDGYFRLALADFLTRSYGLPVEFDKLFITSGISQGLDLLTTLLAASGDTVLVEEPSYFLALRIFEDHRLNTVSIATDEHGIIPDALEEALKEHKPRFLYTIPAFQNPTGSTQTAERRERVVELASEHGFTVLADEVYHLLYFGAPPPPPYGAFVDRSPVISLGSFSKILAPGLRLGWAQAAPETVARLSASGLLDSGGGLNPFTSGVARIALEERWQDEYLQELRDTYRGRAAAMSRALHRELGGAARFQEPGGGYFFWLELPESVDAAALEARAEQQKVGFRAGTKFSSRGALKNFIRLCFAFYDTPQIEEGVARLARALG